MLETILSWTHLSCRVTVSAKCKPQKMAKYAGKSQLQLQCAEANTCRLARWALTAHNTSLTHWFPLALPPSFLGGRFQQPPSPLPLYRCTLQPLYSPGFLPQWHVHRYSIIGAWWAWVSVCVCVCVRGRMNASLPPGLLLRGTPSVSSVSPPCVPAVCPCWERSRLKYPLLSVYFGVGGE